MSAKGVPGFPRHDVKMFGREEFSSMSSESFSYNSNSNHFGSVYGRSVTTTTTIGGDGENRRFIEHFTKSCGRGDEQPITVVMKERSRSDLPEWMEVRASPETERRDVDSYNISVLLKYPGYYTLRKTESEDNANESKIHPEVAKREKAEVVLSLEEDDEDEEESDEEYDEFEEEIVVVDVRRKPVWRRGLEIPKPQPQKVGVAIEDLLEVPMLQPKQESADDQLLIDEKIEHVERPPVVYAELPHFGVLDHL